MVENVSVQLHRQGAMATISDERNYTYYFNRDKLIRYGSTKKPKREP